MIWQKNTNIWLASVHFKWSAMENTERWRRRLSPPKPILKTRQKINRGIDCLFHPCLWKTKTDLSLLYKNLDLKFPLFCSFVQINLNQISAESLIHIWIWVWGENFLMWIKFWFEDDTHMKNRTQQVMRKRLRAHQLLTSIGHTSKRKI